MAITELWTEKYRPNTIEGYVFRDERQREQVNGWLKDGSIPNLLFSGNAGVGKCLAGHELIDVMIESDALTADQLSHLEKYKT